MPKLLSRSKHEEFESNSSLQIRSQKERREKSEEKWSIAKFGSRSTVPSSSTVPSCCPFLLFDASDFCYIFLFLPILTLVIAFVLVFFVTSLTLSTYISLSLYKLSMNSLHFTSAIESGNFPAASFLHFLSPFSAAKHSSKDDNSEDG